MHRYEGGHRIIASLQNGQEKSECGRFGGTAAGHPNMRHHLYMPNDIRAEHGGAGLSYRSYLYAVVAGIPQRYIRGTSNVYDNKSTEHRGMPVDLNDIHR